MTTLGTLQGTNYRKYNGEVADDGKSFVVIKTNIAGGDLRDPVGNVIWSGELKLPIVGGTWQAQLPPTDDATLSATGFVYIVREELAHKPRAQWREVSTPLPAGSVVNMADLGSGVVVPPFPPEQGVPLSTFQAFQAGLPDTFVPRPEDAGTEGQALVLGPDDVIVWGAGGGGGADLFDQRISAYNATPSSLRLARAAVARAASGGATFHVAVAGDSTSASSGTTLANLWHRVMRSLIASRGAVVHGTGLLSVDLATRASGPASTTGLGDYTGGICKSGAFLPNTSGNTFTVTADTDQFRVMYQKRASSGGTMTATVDGGAVASINTSGAGGTGVFFQTYNVTQGNHTLVLTAPTDGNGFILAVEARSGGSTGGVKVSAFARGGRSSAALADSTSEGDGSSIQAITALDADLLVIAMGINDYLAAGDAAGGQTTLAAYKANIEAAIVAQRAAGGDVILVGWLPQANTSKTIPQADYIQQLYDLCDEYDVALLDLQARWGSYSISNPLGYYVDDTHPSDLGAADWGGAGYTLLNSVGLVL